MGAYVIISITNYLGPKNFGLYSYALSFAGIFTAIAALGLDSILVRELVKTPEKHNLIMGTGFVLKLCGVLISFLLLIIAIIFTPNDQYTNLLIFIIAATPIFQSLNVVDFYFR